uniref:Uncharacterized protein n=1 Tax=Erpetoichthys calabaricus TaxID=27687 RepID=A0A8C4TFT3_ERPCA
ASSRKSPVTLCPLFRIHIVTWNVAAATPPDDITSLLGLNVGDGRTDMYIIG